MKLCIKITYEKLIKILKDFNNQSEYAFIIVNDPNLASGLIQISGCISFKKLDIVLFFKKYEYKSK